jgi:uncharacterized protein (TIGR02266 family)
MTTKEEAKRKFRRKPVHVEIRVRDEEGVGDVTFDTSDLSLGGAFLKSDLLLELGEELDLEIPIPGTEPVHVRARVVRASRGAENKSAPGMGIEFIDVSPAVRRLLQKLLG